MAKPLPFSPEPIVWSLKVFYTTGEHTTWECTSDDEAFGLLWCLVGHGHFVELRAPRAEIVPEPR